MEVLDKAHLRNAGEDNAGNKVTIHNRRKLFVPAQEGVGVSGGQTPRLTRQKMQAKVAVIRGKVGLPHSGNIAVGLHGVGVAARAAKVAFHIGFNSNPFGGLSFNKQAKTAELCSRAVFRGMRIRIARIWEGTPWGCGACC